MSERTSIGVMDSNAEIVARMREWADALEKYGSEQRRDVDAEIIWWLRKGAEALEAAQRDPRGSLHSDKAEIRRLRAELAEARS